MKHCHRSQETGKRRSDNIGLFQSPGKTSMAKQKSTSERLRSLLGEGLCKQKTLLLTLDSPFLDNAQVFPYLGILYLMAVARSNGMQIKFLHAKARETSTSVGPVMAYSDEIGPENVDCCRDFDVIGISCMTPQGLQAYRLCEEIKRLYPSKTVILGGPHARFYLDQCLDKGFDIIVSGDGEHLFEAMITADFDLLSNRVTHLLDKTLVLEDSLSVEQMNAFPVPYREEAYLRRYNYLLEDVPATTLVNSRGCPMRCAFCEHSGSLPRWYSPEHFEAEIRTITNLGYQGIMIFDDLFALSPRRICPYLDILKRYHERRNVVFRCFGHARIIAKHPILLEMLAGSGCVEIGIGAESASQSILDGINKRTTVNQLHACINQAAQRGIKVKAFFMIGLPGETERTFAKTHEFIRFYRKKYPFHFDFDLSIFFPYRGTMIGNAIRLKAGESVTACGRTLRHDSFNVRLNPEYTWDEIDSGILGAYKKRGGGSDLVIESYDWRNRKLLLSAQSIQSLKNRTMKYSGRYAHNRNRNHLNATPVSEGNICHGVKTSLRKFA